MSLKDTILSADDLGETIVDVPEWDVKLLIRGMDGLTRSKVQKIATSNDPYANADILILVARDPDSGELVFDKIAESNVLLPDKRSGLAMVFEAFEKASYAIVLSSSGQLKIGDKVKNP